MGRSHSRPASDVAGLDGLIDSHTHTLTDESLQNGDMLMKTVVGKVTSEEYEIILSIAHRNEVAVSCVVRALIGRALKNYARKRKRRRPNGEHWAAFAPPEPDRPSSVANRTRELSYSEGDWEQPWIMAGVTAEMYYHYFFGLLRGEYRDDCRAISKQVEDLLPDATYNGEENTICLHCSEEDALQALVHELNHWATEYLLEEGVEVDCETCERLASWAEAIPIEQEGRRTHVIMRRRICHGSTEVSQRSTLTSSPVRPEEG